MTALELVAELELHDVTLSIKDDRLRVDAPRSSLTPALRTALTQQKVQVMEILRSRTEGHPASTVQNVKSTPKHGSKETLWPAACLESMSRFGQSHAVLFPLIGKTVQTPRGRGRLFHVMSSKDEAFAGVILEGEDRVTLIPTADLKPRDGKLR